MVAAYAMPVLETAWLCYVGKDRGIHEVSTAQLVGAYARSVLIVPRASTAHSLQSTLIAAAYAMLVQDGA
eukprot:3682577-Rhodomonas_salina.1